MNIFFLDHDPLRAAQFHADKHCIKMVLETAQLLSSAHHILDSNPPKNIYKLTHKNHPSAIWVRDSLRNYEWTVKLFECLLLEYKYRYGKIHKSVELLETLKIPPEFIHHNISFSTPPCVMPEEYIILNDVIGSYRNYYKNGKKSLLKWTKRQKPDWI